MAFTKGGKHKLIISPNGVSNVASSRPHIDNTMVKTLARAFRWRKLLETDVIVTVEEIAADENINASYVMEQSPGLVPEPGASALTIKTHH